MPRASVSVRTVRSRRRGKKWSPVFIPFNHTESVIDVAAATVHTHTANLCVNSSNTQTAPTATVIKCGNFKVSFELDSISSNTAMVSGMAAIVFVPQGLTPDADYLEQHPEYVMSWRAFNPGATSSTATTIQSRLKRNLNSGDKVVLFLKVINNNSSLAYSFKLQGAVTYVCCNN